MFPLQITLAPVTYSDSYERFFSQYDRWIKDLKEFDVKPEFVWITPDPPSLRSHRENSKFNRPEHNERYVHLRDVSYDIWNQYEEAKKGGMIQKASEKIEEHTKLKKRRSEEQMRSNEHCTAAGTSIQEVRRAGRIRKNN